MRAIAAVAAAALAVGCGTTSSGRSLLQTPPQEAAESDIEEYLRRGLQDADPVRHGFPLSSAVWPAIEVKVGWINGTDGNATEREWVKDAATKSWCAHSKIKLTGWGVADKTTQIRIHIVDEKKEMRDYEAACEVARNQITNAQALKDRLKQLDDELLAKLNPHTKGLGCHLAQQPIGMVLNFTFLHWPHRQHGLGNLKSPYRDMTPREYAIRNIAVHEFGHALGIAHEQNRGDTPQGMPGCAGPQGTDGDFTIGAWDADSCMNYRNQKWGNYGQLSEGDKATIAFLYPATDGPNMTGTWKGTAASGETNVRFEVDVKQDRTVVTGTARLTFTNSDITREIHYPIHGRRISTVAIFYPKGTVAFFSAINKSPPERRVEYRDGTATVNGQPPQSDEEFRRICQEEMRLAHYVAQKVFCVTSSDTSSRCEIRSGGIPFKLTITK